MKDKAKLEILDSEYCQQIMSQLGTGNQTLSRRPKVCGDRFCCPGLKDDQTGMQFMDSAMDRLKDTRLPSHPNIDFNRQILSPAGSKVSQATDMLMMIVWPICVGDSSEPN